MGLTGSVFLRCEIISPAVVECDEHWTGCLETQPSVHGASVTLRESTRHIDIAKVHSFLRVVSTRNQHLLCQARGLACVISWFDRRVSPEVSGPAWYGQSGLASSFSSVVLGSSPGPGHPLK